MNEGGTSNKREFPRDAQFSLECVSSMSVDGDPLSLALDSCCFQYWRGRGLRDLDRVHYTGVPRLLWLLSCAS